MFDNQRAPGNPSSNGIKIMLKKGNDRTTADSLRTCRPSIHPSCYASTSELIRRALGPRDMGALIGLASLRHGRRNDRQPFLWPQGNASNAHQANKPGDDMNFPVSLENNSRTCSSMLYDSRPKIMTSSYTTSRRKRKGERDDTWQRHFS